MRWTSGAFILPVLLQTCLLVSGDAWPPMSIDDHFTMPGQTPLAEIEEYIPKQVIESFHVYTDIRYRFATTKMTSVVRNTAGIAHEMPFDVTLPKGAFITSFAMTIDGKVYDGEVKEKSEAKEQYNRAVQRGQSAGHIRQTARHSNRFDVSVNVANGTAVNFTLTYQQILSRKLGVYEYEMYVEPGQAVEDFNVEVFIQENRPLMFVKTPQLRKASTLSNKIEGTNDLTTVDRPTETTAHVQYKPTIRQQGSGGLTARFVVQYEVEHSATGDVLVADGYFIHMYTPQPQKALPKDIIFVLDVSGSMSGTKIAQVKDAMKTILEDLTEEDRFNILTFSDDVSQWKRVLTTMTSKVFEEAQQFVHKMKAQGGTNINKALLGALKELQGREVQTRVGMIFFLTDGDATVGETNPSRIARNVQDENIQQTSIYSLAFGDGANFESLKTISTQNFGYARKIYEASDAALQVESLYAEISTVAMKNVSVQYLPTVTKTTETVFPVVHNGTEIVIGGCIDLRYRPRLAFEDDREVFHAEITGTAKEGDLDIVFDVDNVDEITIDTDNSLNSFFTMPRDYSGIIEKMWAFMTIKQMLKEKQAVIEEKDLAEKMNSKILEMSLKYKFVTPLTSMVVTKPDSDSPVQSGLEDADKPSIQPRRAHAMSGVRSKSRHFSQGVPMMGLPTRYNKFNSPPVFDVQAKQVPAIIPIPRPPGSGGRPGRKNRRKKKGGKRKTKTASVGVLSSIVLRTDQSNSLCIAPKKLPSGEYLLAELASTGTLSKGFKATLVTGCVKNCRIVVPETLVLTSSSKPIRINLTLLTKWDYQQHTDFDVTFVKMNEMILEHDDVTISLVREQKGKRMLLSVELRMKTSGNFTSPALTDLLKLKGKKKPQRKTPKACMKAKADASMFLMKRKALKYKV